MIKNKLGGIYIIINKISGKVYVGSAIYLKQRWGVHRYELRTGKHDNKHLLAAWNKYGEASFEFKVLEYTETEDDLISREQYYIDLYQSFLPEKGYNLRPKARNNLGFHHPPEAFEKFKRRIPWNKGKTGVQVSWNKGLTKETDPRLAEIGKKISKAERGRPNKNKGKKRPGFHPPKPFPKDIIPWNKGKKMDATFVEMCKQRELAIKELWDIIIQKKLKKRIGKHT
jgi:group I intron endonuclease